ncbi:hypothetical protein [Rhodovulum sp. P5]|nr:hypothetical protein [Rhodovulum sp. P5]
MAALIHDDRQNRVFMSCGQETLCSYSPLLILIETYWGRSR